MPSRYFPNPELSDPEGLILVGGELSTDWLLDAYRNGIFPWPLNEKLLAWWSPDPRAILNAADFHLPRRLERTCRSGRFHCTIDHAFGEVIQGCATAQDRTHATWITRDLKRAYIELHRLGLAHSVEAWSDGKLTGGIYGVALGAYFAAESMFYLRRDASKVALVHLVRHLLAQKFALIDVQMKTMHTAQFGVREVPRDEFLRRLKAALKNHVKFHP